MDSLVQILDGLSDGGAGCGCKRRAAPASMMGLGADAATGAGVTFLGMTLSPVAIAALALGAAFLVERRRKKHYATSGLGGHRRRR